MHFSNRKTGSYFSLGAMVIFSILHASVKGLKVLVDEVPFLLLFTPLFEMEALYETVFDVGTANPFEIR